MTPKRCKACRTARKVVFEKEKNEEDRIWLENENKEITRLLYSLPYSKQNMSEISVDSPLHTLYVIGNGFDLMHGVYDEGMLGMVPNMMEVMGVLEEDDDNFSAAIFLRQQNGQYILCR